MAASDVAFVLNGNLLEAFDRKAEFAESVPPPLGNGPAVDAGGLRWVGLLTFGLPTPPSISVFSRRASFRAFLSSSSLRSCMPNWTSTSSLSTRWSSRSSDRVSSSRRAIRVRWLEVRERSCVFNPSILDEMPSSLIEDVVDTEGAPEEGANGNELLGCCLGTAASSRSCALPSSSSFLIAYDGM